MPRSALAAKHQSCVQTKRRVIGLLSALVDNVRVMFAVVQMSGFAASIGVHLVLMNVARVWP
jgi:hypothetical protein